MEVLSQFYGEVMSFQISALPLALFAPLLSMTDEALRSHRAMRRVADKKPGFPCRVSLADADVGEPVLLVHFEHQPADTPFRSSHAIYVRENAIQAHCARNEVPESFRSRLLSLRGFDARGMLIDADIAEGYSLEWALERMLETESIGYVHLHFAKPGCYAARVDRV